MSSYIDTPASPRTQGEEMSWRVFTRRRLDWLHGVDRSSRIAAGNDQKTQEDLAAWYSLGKRVAA